MAREKEINENDSQRIWHCERGTQPYPKSKGKPFGAREEQLDSAGYFQLQRT